MPRKRKWISVYFSTKSKTDSSQKWRFQETRLTANMRMDRNSRPFRQMITTLLRHFEKTRSISRSKTQRPLGSPISLPGSRSLSLSSSGSFLCDRCSLEATKPCLSGRAVQNFFPPSRRKRHSRTWLESKKPKKNSRRSLNF